MDFQNVSSVYRKSTFWSSNNISGKEEGSGRDQERLIPTVWYVYVEAVILACVSLVGLVGNIMVMKTSVQITNLAKQNIVLFVSLATCDAVVSGVRLPSLAYMLLRPRWDDGHLVCGIWLTSLIFVFIAIISNMSLGIQRLFIMLSYPTYRKYFTLKIVSVGIATLWFGLAAIFYSLYTLLRYNVTISNTNKMCYLNSYHEDIGPRESLIIRVVVFSLIGFAPIITTTASYIIIIVRILQAGLIKLDRFDDRASYKRVTLIAFFRATILVSFWAPYLFIIIVSPEFPDTINPFVRYFDYVFCLHSVFTPYITLQDTDFKTALHKGRQCIFQQKGRIHQNSTKRSKRLGCSNITSAEMKSFKQTE